MEAEDAASCILLKVDTGSCSAHLVGAAPLVGRLRGPQLSDWCTGTSAVGRMDLCYETQPGGRIQWIVGLMTRKVWAS